MTESVRAWRPPVPGVREVLHATFEHHAYPAHTHADWTILLVDEGAVDYRLERRRHEAAPAALTLLPPEVPHDGRSAVAGRPFRKRVLYVDGDWLPTSSVGAAASRPTIGDPRAATAAAAVHVALSEPTDVLQAEDAVLDLRRLLAAHLGPMAPHRSDAPMARRLRELLDDRLAESVTLADAGRLLGSHPGHLSRCFREAYGIAPHQYVVGRRIDLARRLLVAGRPPAEVAVAVGFHDQAHLGRHFRKVLGTTPGRFAA